MSWTYTADPLNNALDEVRMLVGDTNDNFHIMQDEELQYFISTYSDVNLRLSKIFYSMAAKFSSDTKKALGPQSEDARKRHEQLLTFARLYEKKASGVVGSPTLVLPTSTSRSFTKGFDANVS